MGRRRRWKSKGLAAPYSSPDADPTTRSITISGSKVAVACGRRWRVIDVSIQREVQTDASHHGAVRGIAFSPDGQHMVTCGDDKTARVWRVSDWRCIRVLKSAKKASACTFSADGRHIFFADRFGDVLTATTIPATAAANAAADSLPMEAQQAAAQQNKAAAAAAAAAAESDSITPKAEEPSLLLGHLQAIISSLTPISSSSGQPLLVSTDREGKVRASIVPKDPTKGSYEIQTYCLGHTVFVTCSAAVPPSAGSSSKLQLLVSGGGDGTVRLWDVDTGKQLACYMASEPPKDDVYDLEHKELQSEQQDRQQDQQQAEGLQVWQQNGQQVQQQPEGVQQAQQANEQQSQQQHAAASGATAAGNGYNSEQDGSESEGGESDGDDTADDQMESQAGLGAEGKQGHVWYPKLRQKCSAVLSLAVSPDGITVAAAVEGHQEVQILHLDAAASTLQLAQKLQLDDVANPSTVAFDGEGRLWVVGGLLLLETESAHVGVATKDQAAGEFQPVTASLLPGSVRNYLECRVQKEEDAAAQQQGSYYHEGFKRKVYKTEEVLGRKKVRTDHKENERLKALRAAESQQEQQE